MSPTSKFKCVRQRGKKTGISAQLSPINKDSNRLLNSDVSGNCSRVQLAHTLAQSLNGKRRFQCNLYAAEKAYANLIRSINSLYSRLSSVFSSAGLILEVVFIGDYFSCPLVTAFDEAFEVSVVSGLKHAKECECAILIE